VLLTTTLQRLFGSANGAPRFHINRIWTDASKWHVEISVNETEKTIVLERTSLGKWIDLDDAKGNLGNSKYLPTFILDATRLD
jgi:hypothetical protein